MKVIDDFLKHDLCKSLEEDLLRHTFPWGYLSQSIPTPMQYPTHLYGPEPDGPKWPSEIPNEDFMFCHTFFQEVDDLHNQMAKEAGEEERDYMIAPTFQIIEPTIQPILDFFGMEQHSLLRIKANLDTLQKSSMTHCGHTDYPVYTYEGTPYTTAVFHVNDNNGITVVGEEKIEQVANRLIIFDGSTSHYGITQTDVSARLLINYNFRGKLYD
jgi:hypothetical protein